MLYTISIAVHNNLELTKKCIDSILSGQYSQLEIIVFDNASDAETVKYLAGMEKSGAISLMRSPANLGFGEAHNRVLKVAKGVYFLVLNNDLEVPAGMLEAMRAQFLGNPRLGICGVKNGCHTLTDMGIGKGGGQLEYIEGACLMIPTYLAKREGLFDMTAYRFAYVEDADLSLRLRKSGYEIGCVDMPLSHQRAATSSQVRKEGTDIDGYHSYNHVQFRSRWAGYFQNDRGFETSILIRRRGAIGDVLLTTPVIRELKRQNAQAQIAVETLCPEVFDRNPDVFLAAKKVESYDGDCVEFNLDLSYESKPTRHIIDAYADKCGVRIRDYIPRIYPSHQDREFAAKMLPQGKWVSIHPGTVAWPGRNWLPEKWEQVASQLKKDGWNIAVVGDSMSPQISCDADMRGKSTLHQLAALIERANLFVGIDSLPMHLAQASLTPLVSVFGMIDPKYRLIDIPFFMGVTAPLDSVGCLGCHHAQEPPRTTGTCFRHIDYCMERLSADSVLTAAREVLEVRKMYLETSKIREKVLGYCTGRGIDIGCGRDKIKADAVGFDDDPWPEVDKVGDASGPLPFDNGHFDYVYSSHCLEDIADTEGTLAEWLRTLREGGRIILCVPHPDLYKGVNLDHKYPGFRPDELTAILRRIGCDILESYVDDGPNRYSTVVVAEKNKR